MKTKQKFSILARLKSFVFAWNGIKEVLKTEHNLWIHLFFAGIATGLGFYFSINKMEWIALVFAISIVISAEIINSAIETFADFISPKHQEKIGKVKDMAAAAVLVVACGAFIVGVLIFYKKFIHFLS